MPLSRGTTLYVHVGEVPLLSLAVVGGAVGSVAARSIIRQAIGQRTKGAGIRAVDQTTS